MNDTQKQMLEVLNETVEYYGETVTNRAKIIGSVRCQYQVGEKVSAIGRYLTKENMLALKKANKLNDCIGGIWFAIDNVNIKSLPIDFWRDIQHLHDHPYFWCVAGLNEGGRVFVEHILKRVTSDSYSYEEFKIEIDVEFERELKAVESSKPVKAPLAQADAVENAVDEA